MAVEGVLKSISGKSSPWKCWKPLTTTETWPLGFLEGGHARFCSFFLQKNAAWNFWKPLMTTGRAKALSVFSPNNAMEGFLLVI